jgi:tRNA modification GTPase
LSFLRDGLLQFVSLIELELDFSEEDVEFANREKLLELATKIKTDISRLLQSFNWKCHQKWHPGCHYRGTNAGKSTLLNLLHNEKKPSFRRFTALRVM